MIGIGGNVQIAGICTAAEEKSHLVAQVPHALLPQLLSAYDQSSRLLRVTL